MFHALILTIVSNSAGCVDSLWVFAVFLSDIDGNELGKSQIIINKCVFHENSETWTNLIITVSPSRTSYFTRFCLLSAMIYLWSRHRTMSCNIPLERWDPPDYWYVVMNLLRNNIKLWWANNIYYDAGPELFATHYWARSPFFFRFRVRDLTLGLHLCVRGLSPFILESVIEMRFRRF